MTMTEKIAASDLRQYGVYSDLLADLIQQKSNADAVIAALNNADVEGVLLQLLEKSPEKIFRGMEIAAQIVGCSKKVLYIPEYAASLAQQLKVAASEQGIDIQVGIVDVRVCANSLICHLVTLAELSDLADDCRQEGVYLSVNGGELKKYPGSTTLRELVGSSVKGIQTGYQIRGINALDMAVADCNIENGVVNAITTEDCVVEKVAERLLSCRRQSCGKCVFCREGLLQLDEMYKDFMSGKGRTEELDLIKEIGGAMLFSTPCSMGQVASWMSLAAIEDFRNEYDAHIRKHTCPAGSCLAFVHVYINPLTCTGCGQCLSSCKAQAIDSRPGYIHMIDVFDCVKCGDCIPACTEGAIVRTTGRVPHLPDRFVKVGKFSRY